MSSFGSNEIQLAPIQKLFKYFQLQMFRNKVRFRCLRPIRPKRIYNFLCSMLCFLHVFPCFPHVFLHFLDIFIDKPINKMLRASSCFFVVFLFQKSSEENIRQMSWKFTEIYFYPERRWSPKESPTATRGVTGAPLGRVWGSSGGPRHCLPVPLRL